MHACGYDFHTAALLGAAKELSALRDKFSGTVLLAFQQAEESQHGSKFFVREGLTKGYDRAFGIHISPAFPAGKIAMTRGTDAASCDYFKITLRGKSAHISKPHLGNDALAAAAELALKLPSIQPRILNPLNKQHPEELIFQSISGCFFHRVLLSDFPMQNKSSSARENACRDTRLSMVYEIDFKKKATLPL